MLKIDEKTNVTITISKEAEFEIESIKLFLREHGAGKNPTTKGKIVQELVLMPGAREYLKQRLIG